MEFFELAPVIDFLKLALLNKYTAVGTLGLFVGWNLPQPAAAKYVQDKLVQLVGSLWNNMRNKS